MKRIRLATPEEIEAIKDTSDLDAGCMVLALDTPQGVPLAVVRTAVEVDPVHFPPEISDRLKMIFMRDIETVLAAKGVPAYYFQLPASDEARPYRETMEHWGAQRVSTSGEFRFKKVL